MVGHANRDALRAAERGPGAFKAGDDPRQRHLQRIRERGGGERVVDVVEAGQGQCNLGLARGCVQREARGPHAFQTHIGGEHRRHRPRLAAGWAVVVAEVAEVDSLEEIGGAAVAAVLGVGGVGHVGEGERVVVHPEVHGTRPSLALPTAAVASAA